MSCAKRGEMGERGSSTARAGKLETHALVAHRTLMGHRGKNGTGGGTFHLAQVKNTNQRRGGRQLLERAKGNRHEKKAKERKGPRKPLPRGEKIRRGFLYRTRKPGERTLLVRRNKEKLRFPHKIHLRRRGSHSQNTSLKGGEASWRKNRPPGRNLKGGTSLV